MKETSRTTQRSRCSNRQTPSKQQTENPCSQLPGTILRIYIPAGTVINLLNLIELNSPSGICLIIRLPILGEGFDLQSLFSKVQQAGGAVEISKK